MKNHYLLVSFILVGMIMVSGWLYAYQSSKKPRQTILPSPTIAVSIYPLYDMVRNVAEPNEAITLLVPPGTDPLKFDIASSAAQLETIHTVFVSGELDATISAYFHSRNVRVVSLDTDVVKSEKSPYYWLSLDNAKKIVETVAVELKQTGTERVLGYQQQLSQLQEMYQQKCGAVSLAELNTSDPYGGAINTDTYIALMQSNINAICK